MSKPFFITTAIDYTNGAPHIGHAYEKVLADVLARYHRLKGEDVFYLTGVDQHGQKVQQSAEKMGVEPQQFVDEITAKFRALWKKLGVEYDDWAETTDEHRHKKSVRDNLQILWDDKDPATGASKWLYKKTERGWYSVRQEQFLTDKERGVDGEFGSEWQPVEEREEENFYFRLREHKDWLRDFIKQRSRENNPFVVPDFRVNELLNAVEKIEGDLCISRPASRLKWGIPFPDLNGEGVGFVTYVWFDALVNYISFVPGHNPKHSELGAGQETEFAKWWSAALHVIGKDILIPAHGVYWPVMLKAFEYADEEIPTLLVHGWWNIAGAKMSKSLGNVIDPDALADKYGPEALRYYLMSDIATGKDADFDESRLVIRYNTDLANSLGNLLNRTLNMVQKYRAGRLKKWDSDESPAGKMLFESWKLKRDAQASMAMTAAMFDVFETAEALKYAQSIATHCNLFIQNAAPWTLAKSLLPEDADGLDAVLYTLAESLRIIAILISPVLPKAAQGIFDQLNWKMAEQGQETRFRLADAQWGGLPDGHVLGQPTPLFPRIEAAPAA